MAMYGQRSGLVPIEPINDEIMGLRNLEATAQLPEEVNIPAQQYYATQEKISGLGDAYSDRAAHFARGVAADAHSGMGNTDEQSNARYQELLQKREDLKKQIAQLSADIAYQEKLRAIEMKNDPMWDIAKQQYIMKGDSSGLESIMSRMEAEKGRDLTRETAKSAKAAEDASKKESRTKTFRKNLALVNWAYDEMNRNEDSASRRAALTAYLDLVGSAEDLGMSMEELKASMDPQMAERLESMRYGAKTPTEPSVGNTGAQNISDLQTRVDNSLKSAKSEADFDAILSMVKNNETMLGGSKAKDYTDLVNKVENAKKTWVSGAPARLKRQEINRINALPARKRKAEAEKWNKNNPKNKIDINKDIETEEE